jgi:hypothetical protein
MNKNDIIDNILIKFIPIVKNKNLTSTNLSITSFVSMIFSLFLFEKNFRILSSFIYILGYIFLRISQNLQKVQNDKIVNDIIYLFGNFLFSLYFIYVLVMSIKVKNIKIIIFMLLLVIYNILLFLRFSIKEAIDCYDITFSDNFYQKYYNQLAENKDQITIKFYLFIMNFLYKFYKSIFKQFNKNKLENIIKNTPGDGIYTIFLSILILFI